MRHELGENRWHLFNWELLACAVSVFVLLYGFLIIFDPFDTGRLGILQKGGTTSQGPRLANVSRGRDSAFDAAIIGNSHVQLLSPSELDKNTELRFVSLVVPATLAREQLVILKYFVRHRRKAAKAIVIGIDTNWCTDNPNLPAYRPFPFWLYDESFWTYMGGLLRLEALERLPSRLAHVLGLRVRLARRDGYWDYEPDYLAVGYGSEEARRRLHEGRSFFPRYHSGNFPAATRLREALNGLSPSTQIILVRPPVVATALPAPGSQEEEVSRACGRVFQAIAEERPRGVLLDWFRRRPEVYEKSNFLDHSHYRARIARLIEHEIVQALGQQH
jgi:hypothetical protein